MGTHHGNKKHWATRFSLLALCGAVLGLCQPAAALDFSGYLRAGGGISTKKGGQQCFQLPGAPAKYRLGNECEQLAEPTLSHEFVQFSNGSSLSALGMLQVFNQYNRTPKFRSSAPDNIGYAKMVQAYVSWNNAPVLNGGSLWAGRKYYRRNDVHINDFFYWNPSGLGVGVENVGIGEDLKLSYAFFRKGADVFDKNYVSRHDLQLGGITTNPGGALEVGLSYIPRTHGRAAGWSGTVQHKQAFGEHSNTVAFQYGRGTGTGLGQANIASRNSDSSFRLVDAVYWRYSPRLDGQITAAYQKDRYKSRRDGDWFTLGARAVYAFNNQWKLATELGFDSADPGTGHRGSLTKLTIAPTWTFTGIDGSPFKSRPDLRLYYTYAKWNRAARSNAALGSTLARDNVYASQSHGSNFGVQIEHWW